MLAHFLLTTLGAQPNRYQSTHPQGVEDRAHLVVGYLHPLLQEPSVDEGALQRASRAFFPLLADDLAHLLGQLSSAVSVSSHCTYKIKREELLVQTLDRTSEKSSTNTTSLVRRYDAG